MPSRIPLVPEAAAGPLVRVLTWIYRREDETIHCRLALTSDCSAYELKIQPPCNPAGGPTELFDDAQSAFERQTTIERSLMTAGFVLARFESPFERQL